MSAVIGYQELNNAPTGSYPALPPIDVLQAWRTLPPVLRGPGLVLRELRSSDAPALAAMLPAGDLRRFIATGASGLEDPEGFIAQAQDDRAAGRAVCLGVVPADPGVVVGTFSLRPVEPGFASAEWAFVLNRAYWGAGVFFSAAPLVADFAFEVLGAHRLEARVPVTNGRAIAALRRLGATSEAVLRDALCLNGCYADQELLTIMAADWRHRR